MTGLLITGADSYIGTRLENYLKNYPGEYRVSTLDLTLRAPKETDFSGFDVVFHVAGIAHIKETPENAELYYRVNRDLAVETAKKAKAGGVGQFIFMSTMAVYGLEEGAVNKNTLPAPKTNYGRSKLQAEEGIFALEDENFAVAALRPPMVYGPDCKGNYRFLVKLARCMPVFPDYVNRRSMISIENLCKFVKDTADGKKRGVFLPQDGQYVCTCRMVRDIAADMGRKLPLWKILNPAVALAKRFTSRGKKAFGDLYYEKD